ncbi:MULTISPECIES: RstC protein [Vibrio]|uniref:RstC protein n=1 Tax=Vibrio TaxID=662 RepID=UPI0009767C4C|nr:MULTISPECIES: RstC protein [Vibrio]OMO28271.1 RstC protein [Vibrio sp. 10N.222.47.A9]PMJ19410.1 RstC protein [Vibrio lentus]CAK3420671.1 RstC protein [Vibrio crassostreae]
MSFQEYTLTDVSDKVNDLHDMSLFLNSGSYTEEIGDKLTFHMMEEIETLQSMLSFIRIYPQIQAQEQLDSPQKELTP